MCFRYEKYRIGSKKKTISIKSDEFHANGKKRRKKQCGAVNN